MRSHKLQLRGDLNATKSCTIKAQRRVFGNKIEATLRNMRPDPKPSRDAWRIADRSCAEVAPPRPRHPHSYRTSWPQKRQSCPLFAEDSLSSRNIQVAIKYACSELRGERRNDSQIFGFYTLCRFVELGQSFGLQKFTFARI